MWELQGPGIAQEDIFFFFIITKPASSCDLSFGEKVRVLKHLWFRPNNIAVTNVENTIFLFEICLNLRSF